jgi:hypothetical protein
VILLPGSLTVLGRSVNRCPATAGYAEVAYGDGLRPLPTEPD